MGSAMNNSVATTPRPMAGDSPETSPTATVPGGASAEAPPFPFFEPSFDMAVIGMFTFLALSAVHIGMVVKTRAYFFSLLPQGALMMGVGMTFRVILISFPGVKGIATISRMLLMAPGTLTSLQLYFTYTRLMWWTTPPTHRNISTLWLPPRATTFTLSLSQNIGDIITMLGTGQFFPSPGPKTLPIGAIISMFVFMGFTGLVARFVHMSRGWEMNAVKRQESLKLGIALLVSGVFLSIRGVVQIMEQDALATLLVTKIPTPVISTEEWPTWVFNVLPIFLIHFVMAQCHPGQLLPRRLIGFRLNTRMLLKDEKAGKFGDELGREVPGHGRVIGQPMTYQEDVDAIYEKEMKFPVGHAI